MTFHCDKLCSGECCFPLLKALALVLRDHVTCAHIPNVARGDVFGATMSMSAHAAIDDASELAKLLTIAGAARGLEYEVYAEHDTRVVVRIPDPTWPNMPRYCNHTLPSARALLLAIMQTPADPSSRERVETILKGDAS